MKKRTVGMLLVCMTVLGNATPTLTIRKNEQVDNLNIALGTPMQPFGSYLAVVEGGTILSPRQIFYVGTDVGGEVTNTSNFVLVDKNNMVIAGPVDPEYLFEGPPLGRDRTITFTDIMTFSEGTNMLFLKGTVKTSFQPNARVVTGTAPSLWTVTDLNGTILPQENTGLVIGQTMTVRGPTLTVSFTPGEQTVVAGSQQVSFGAYVLDATQSSEDIRINVIAGDYRFNEANRASDLVEFTLYDGATPLTTGINIVDPLQFGTQIFRPDYGVVVPKGTIKTISQKVSIRNGTSGSYQWSIPATLSDSFKVVGSESGVQVKVVVQPSPQFILNVVPHGEVALTQEYTPAISESGNGDVFFAFSILPTGETFEGGAVTFVVQASPASRFQTGNGLAHPRLKSETVSIESVLLPFQEKGDVTSYLVSFNLMQGLAFYQDIKTDLRFTMEYDNALQTGDEVIVSFAGNNPEFTGATSGVRVTPSVPSGARTVVIRRVPEQAVGDVDRDGKIDANDLKRMIIALKVWRASSSQPMPAALFPELNTFPDNVIDDWDVATLDAYLKGLFLTLPVGDVNYDWKFTTADIGLARAGILGMRLLRNFQVRQADINKSGGVTTLDIVLMRRLILGLGIGR